MKEGESINKLKGFRVMAGFSQEELAEKIGMHRVTYVNKEVGKAKLTNDEKVNIVIALKEKLPDLQIGDIFDS